jgi:hypothetical protein
MSCTAHWKSIGAKYSHWWGLHIQKKKKRLAEVSQKEGWTTHYKFYELLSVVQNGFVPLNVFY